MNCSACGCDTDRWIKCLELAIIGRAENVYYIRRRLLGFITPRICVNCALSAYRRTAWFMIVFGLLFFTPGGVMLLYFSFTDSTMPKIFILLGIFLIAGGILAGGFFLQKRRQLEMASKKLQNEFQDYAESRSVPHDLSYGIASKLIVRKKIVRRLKVEDAYVTESIILSHPEYWKSA